MRVRGGVNFEVIAVTDATSPELLLQPRHT